MNESLFKEPLFLLFILLVCQCKQADNYRDEIYQKPEMDTDARDDYFIQKLEEQ